MKITSFGLTDTGLKREKNEDYFLLNDEMGLYIVADGMGGHQGGDYASRLAVETIEEELRRFASDPSSVVPLNGIRTAVNDYKGQLRHAVLMASHRIYASALRDKRLRGMGTTSVVILIRNNKIYLANVGDSRAYILRGREVRQLTEDHSLVQEQLKAGMISPLDARDHRLRNIITRSVGFQDEVDIDVDECFVQKDDKVILCTDGLSNMVTNDEISQIVADESVETACRRLIDLANSRGGEDNATVVIAHILELDAEKSETEEESTILSD